MKNKSLMKLGVVICGLELGLAGASASLSYAYSGSSQIIPDGNSVGITSVAIVSGDGSIASLGDNVSVTLDVRGGNMGDLYASLTYGGHTAVLLNQPGKTDSSVGYLGGSLNVTLSDFGESGNINAYGGGNASGVYSAAGGSTAFQTFNGLSSVAGGWTLYFADLSGGDKANVSTLNGWSLEVTAVPEPINVALAVFGVVLVGTGIVRRCNRNRKMISQ